jgi:hypothetical protein
MRRESCKEKTQKLKKLKTHLSHVSNSFSLGSTPQKGIVPNFDYSSKQTINSLG